MNNIILLFNLLNIQNGIEKLLPWSQNNLILKLLTNFLVACHWQDTSNKYNTIKSDCYLLIAKNTIFFIQIYSFCFTSSPSKSLKYNFRILIHFQNFSSFLASFSINYFYEVCDWRVWWFDLFSKIISKKISVGWSEQLKPLARKRFQFDSLAFNYHW